MWGGGSRGKFVEVEEESLRPLGPVRKVLAGVPHGPGLQETLGSSQGWEPARLRALCPL